MSWKQYKLGEILARKKVAEKLFPNKSYKLVTIKLYHKGVTLRKIVKGNEVGSSMSRINVGDFILSGIDARNGAFGIVPEGLDGAIITNDFWCLEPNEKIIDKEFLLYLTSTDFFDHICKQSSDGTTQRIRLQKDKFFNYDISLPPLVTQKRLLKKFNQITDLNSLVTSELNTQKDLLTRLRQSFLREALQGKLVKQDPKDGHAKDLLEKIKAEKAKLGRKEKELLPIKPEEIPFEIPKSWIWCRLGEIIIDTEGGKSPNCLNEPAKEDEWGVIKTTAIQEMHFLENENKVLPKSFKVNDSHKVSEGDVIITRAGPKNRVGIVCCVEELTRNLILSDKTIRILHSKKLVSSKFLAYALNSPIIKPYIEMKMVGMADSQVNISQDNMKTFPIPFPPLSEQTRIVNKLDQLMKLSDELQESVQASRKKNSLLLEQVLKEALQKED